MFWSADLQITQWDFRVGAWDTDIILFLCGITRYPCRLRRKFRSWRWPWSVGGDRYTTRIKHKFAQARFSIVSIGTHCHVEQGLESADAAKNVSTKKMISSMIMTITMNMPTWSNLNLFRLITTNRMNNVDIQKSTERAKLHPQGVNKSKGSWSCPITTHSPIGMSSINDLAKESLRFRLRRMQDGARF